MKLMNIFVLSMMCLVVSSCRSVERTLVCNEVKKYQIDPTEACIVSIKFDACLCTSNFDVNSWSAETEFRKEPLEYCEGIMGVKRDFALAEIQPKFVALQRLRESSCNPRKKEKVNLESLKTSSKPTSIQKMIEDAEYSSHSYDSRNQTSKDEQ